MGTLELPQPIYGPEILAEQEFLPDLQPLIDPITGSPNRLLAQLIISTLQKEMSLASLSQRIANLKEPGHKLPDAGFDNLHTRLEDYVQTGFAPAGIARLGEMKSIRDRRVLAAVFPTEKSRIGAATVGVLASHQLTYNIGINAALGTVSGKGEQYSMYPNAPSLRLRLAQFMVADNGMYIEDVMESVGRDAQQLRGFLGYMYADGLVAKGRRHSRHLQPGGAVRHYDLTPTVRPFMTNLLISLASLRSDTYCQKVIDATQVLLNPTDGPPLVRQLVSGWNVPPNASQDENVTADSSSISELDHSGLYLERLLMRYTDTAEHSVMQKRVQELIDTRVVHFSRNGDLLELNPALVASLSSFERRLLMQGHRVSHLMTGDMTLLTREEIMRKVNSIGFTTVEDYANQVLLPKVQRIIGPVA